MGEIYIFTKEQQIILDEVKQSELFKSQFYFTGGTALAVYYLNHRYSDDLDFFSQKQFDNQIIFTLMHKWGQKHAFTFQSQFVEVVYKFDLIFKNNIPLKVDFAYYPYKRVENGNNIDGIDVDSKMDIAINKLLTLSQRTDVKDFVDLYFLLQKFSIWDLMHGVKVKFGMEIEPLLLGADFLKIEDFDFLPKMIIPLTLKELKVFFRQQAKDMGIKAVTK